MGALLDLVFPPRCAACGRPGWPLCEACGREVAVIVPPLCARCGRPTEEPVEACAECPPKVIDAVRAPFLYEGPIARAIRGMKFSGWRALGPHLARAMAEVSTDLAGGVVTWVPLSRRRRARRGFDQAEVLARELARALGLPAARLLRRRRDTTEQARRTARERRAALRGVFESTAPAPAAVILVDDVLTTGSTAATCAAELKRAGARAVSVAVAARTLAATPPARCLGGMEGDQRGR